MKKGRDGWPTKSSREKKTTHEQTSNIVLWMMELEVHTKRWSKGLCGL